MSSTWTTQSIQHSKDRKSSGEDARMSSRLYFSFFEKQIDRVDCRSAGSVGATRQQDRTIRNCRSNGNVNLTYDTYA